MSTASTSSSATPSWARAGCRWSSGGPRPSPAARTPPGPAPPPARGPGGGPMDIDLSVLRSLEAEKDISMELAVKAIEDALLVAYHRSGGASPTARVAGDRRTGHVEVWGGGAGGDGGGVG